MSQIPGSEAVYQKLFSPDENLVVLRKTRLEIQAVFRKKEFFTIIIGIFGISLILISYFSQDVIEPVFSIPFGIILIIGAIIVSINYFLSYRAQLEDIDLRIGEFEETSIDKPDRIEEEYFEKLVSINVRNLEIYYGMVKKHTDKSFNASIFAGTIGLLLVAGGLIIGFRGEEQTQTIAYISSGAGVLTEFIAGVFFYLYNKTVQQLKEYHDSLLDVQNVLLSFKLISDKTFEVDTETLHKMIGFLIDKRNPSSQ